MEQFSHGLSGLIILLVLGLRHGLDPDHITLIDSYTYRLHAQHSRWAKWVGTLFTLGHGLMVTVISLVLSFVTHAVEIPLWLEWIIEWVPMVLLTYIGILNILQLRGNTSKGRFSLRQCLVPARFHTHVNPLSIVVTGLIFGFIFDTSSQIAAFGYTVSDSGQWIFSLLGGLVFSAGLIITGTLDSLLLNRLLQSFERDKIQRFRFKINVLITIMCFAIPLYKVVSTVKPALELSDLQNNIIGLFFIGIILSLYAEMYFRFKRSHS